MLEFDEVDGAVESPTLNLLDGEGPALFPGGTRVFPSKYHPSRRLWGLVGVAACVTVVSWTGVLLLGLGGGSTAQRGLGIAWLVAVALLAAVAWLWHRQDFRAYVDKVESGLWLEGVFVFSTGDVVVRFNDVLHNLEMEFDSGTVSHVVADDAGETLVIHYTDLSGAERTFRVGCDVLVDKPSSIAEAINSRDRTL